MKAPEDTSGQAEFFDGIAVAYMSVKYAFSGCHFAREALSGRLAVLGIKHAGFMVFWCPERQ